MELVSAIVGTILILICIVPFIVIHYNRVNKETKMVQMLNENARHSDCEISHHEVCGDFVLGLDENKNWVFFFKQHKEKAISQFVDLAEIQVCQVVKKTRTANNDIVSFGSTERVELCLTPANKSKAETRFELYDENVNSQLRGELQFGDKWAKQINSRLKVKK